MKPAATPHINSHVQALAEHRQKLAAERLSDQAAAIVGNAVTGSFASLRPKQHTTAGDRAVRLLAESATRRLTRWTDPATGGLDADDRDGLLRQADVLGIAPAAAARVLAGVEQAWQQRLRPQSVVAQAVDAAQSKPWRRRLLLSVFILTAVTLLAVQWFMLDVWRALLQH